MNKREEKILLLGVAFIVICLIGAYIYVTPQTEKELDKKIGVIVSIPPQAEFVERVGGDRVQVTVMVPAGASPHTYEPAPSQLRAVSSAKIYAEVGSGLEFEAAWMNKISSTNREMLVVNCSKNISFIGTDPHVWLSPRNAEIMVENIYRGLIQIDPTNQEYYMKNKERYLQELDGLDKKIIQAIAGKENRKIMVYHPAWTYLCRDYGLEQIAIEKEGKEPTPQGIADLIKQARKDNITVVFASPQFSTKSAEVIASEINGNVVLISPLERNYMENMHKVAETFAEV